MKPLNKTLFALAISTSLTAQASAQSTHKSDYQAGKDWLANEYQTARTECAAFHGHPQAICAALAKGMATTGNADLDARHTPTPKTRYRAGVANAESGYAVARLRCQSQAGQPRSDCLRGAQATLTAAKANALQHFKSGDTPVPVDMSPITSNRKCAGQSVRTERRCLLQAKARVHET